MEIDFDRLTAEIIRIYSDAEFEIMDRVRARLERGVPEDRARLREWERRRLGEISQLRHELERTLGRIDNEAARALQSAIEAAFNIGFEGAARDLGTLAQFVRALTPEQLEGISRSALRLAEESLGKLRATHAAILRQVFDVYRSVIRDVIGIAVAQAVAPRVAMQRALNRFADRGITSFVDRRGRRWDMVSYADMATRTAAQRAAVHGYLDTVGEAGVDLVEVVNIPEECPICRPWEGRVLVRRGSHPKYPSVDEAMQGGLFHPNCRHGLTIWVEGLPGAPANRQTRTQKAGRQPKGLDDDEGYQERLRHRQLERNLRKAKLREAVAMQGPARRLAARRVARARNDLKTFLGRTGRKRQPWRESVKGRAITKPKPGKPRTGAAKPKTAKAPPVKKAPKPKPEAIKAGSRMGDKFDNRVKLRAARADIDDAVKAIDGLHRDGPLRRLRVDGRTKKGNLGEFRYNPWGRSSDSIGIKPSGSHRAMTTAHEIGHFIDFEGLGGGQYFSRMARNGGGDEATRKWWRAVQDSPTWHELERRRDSQFAPYTWNGSYYRYLSSPEEAWARSYAQWVGTKRPDSQVGKDLKAERERNGTEETPGSRPGKVSQWPDDEFEPIGEAIEEMFKERGWLD